MEWKEMNKEINTIILDNRNIESLVEELVEYLDGLNIDQDDKDRAENVLYGHMDETDSYRAFVRRVKPKLRRTLTVEHYSWAHDDEKIEDDIFLSSEQIEGGLY